MRSTEELKALIQSHRVKTQSNRLSPELKKIVTEAFLASRVPLTAFSKAIGVAPMSVLKWSKDMPSRAPTFNRVAVIDEAPARGLVLHGPCGVRIEGLDSDALCQILRALGGR
jgi:hypothetical protein